MLYLQHLIRFVIYFFSQLHMSVWLSRSHSSSEREGGPREVRGEAKRQHWIFGLGKRGANELDAGTWQAG